ncbi:Ferritin heavy polypeptide-like 17 [Lemmus lemmus]
MALFFDRDDVALENFKRFFLSKSHSCKASAQMFMFLQNKRGGLVFFPSISTPERDSWHGSLQAMEFAFHMEMTINQSLLNLHKLAKEKGAADLCYFLEHHCLNEQAHVLHKMSGYLANLRQMGVPENSFTDYPFDELSLS